MPNPWRSNVRHIENGQPVDASNSGRPDRDLEARTNYLLDRLDAVERGEAIYAFDAAVDAAVDVGMAVYWNDGNGRFERAVAELGTTADGVLAHSVKADVIGVVLAKTSSTGATLLLAGKAALDADTLAGVVEGTLAAGRYYLSGTSPGMLTRQSPGVSVAVLFYDGDGTVYVQVQLRDLAETHVHYKFELETDPAGSTGPPGGDSRHTIDAPDADKAGWLPAGHPSFQGLAPARAAFGYNLPQHQALNRVWPPLPEEGASLVLFDEGQGGLGREVPLGADGLAIIDRHGIWWMSDCTGDVPWAPGLETAWSSSSEASSAGPECPRETHRRLTLYFARSRYAIDRSAVTKLTPKTGSPITITNCDGDPDSVGDLEIGFDAELLTEGEDALGSLVVKEMTDGARLRRGRVVEGIKGGNDTVTLTSTVSRLEDPGNPDSATVHQGIVTIQANIEPSERLLLPTAVRLLNAKERYEEGILYLAFPAGQATGLHYKFKLPGEAGFPDGARAKLRLWLSGDASGTLPSLTLVRRRLPRPTSATALPTSDSSLAITTAVALTADQYVEVDSVWFDVAESDELLFKLTRASGDGYAGEVGVIDAVVVLAPGE